MSRVSLDGRSFRGVENYDDGDFTRDTIFNYRQADQIVWGTFAGGRIRIGTIVGIASDNGTIEFKFIYVSEEFGFREGVCVSRVSRLPDGRLRIDEAWSYAGDNPLSGTSAVEEVLA